MQAINWASRSEGAKMVDFSSELEGCDATHVLDPNLANIWLSEEGLPQWLCISLDDVKEKRELVIRTIGWHCWHPYTTNPKEVTVHVSSDGAKFKIWDTFFAQQIKGTQLFCCAPISTSIYPYVALEVVQTFGGTQTYMNRAYMYAEEIPTSPPPPTQQQSASSLLLSTSSPQREQMTRMSSHSAQSPPSKHHIIARQAQPDPRDPRRSSEAPDLGLGGLSAVLEFGHENLQLHRQGYGHGHGGGGSDFLHNRGGDASFLSDDFGPSCAGELRPMEGRLAALEHALGWRRSSQGCQVASSSSQWGGEATAHQPQSAEQRLAQLEARLATLVSEGLDGKAVKETKVSIAPVTDPLGPGAAASNDEASSLSSEEDDASCSSFDTERSGAPIFPENVRYSTRGGARDGHKGQNQKRNRSKNRVSSRHEGRFSRAIRGIEGLVASVLERVEQRHSLAVKAVAGVAGSFPGDENCEAGDAGAGTATGTGAMTTDGGRLKKTGVIGFYPTSRVASAGRRSHSPPMSHGRGPASGRAFAATDGIVSGSGSGSIGNKDSEAMPLLDAPLQPPPLNLAGIRAECFGLPDWELLGLGPSLPNSPRHPPKAQARSQSHAQVQDQLRSVSAEDPELTALVASLHDAVLRRTYKEAQLQLLLGGRGGAGAELGAQHASFADPRWSPPRLSHSQPRSAQGGRIRLGNSPQSPNAAAYAKVALERRRKASSERYTASLPRWAQATAASAVRKKVPAPVAAADFHARGKRDSTKRK